MWQDVLIGVPGSGGGDNGLTLVTKATEVLPCAGVTGIWQTQDGRGSSHPDAERIGVLTVDSYVDGSGTTQPAQTWVQFLDEFHMRVEDNTGGACTFEDPDGVVHTGPLIIPPGGRFRLLDVATSTSTVCSGVSTFPDSDFTELGASVSLHPSPGTAPVYTGLQFPVAVTGGGARIDLILDMSTLDFSEAKMDASCRIIGTGGLRGGLFELTNRTDICED